MRSILLFSATFALIIFLSVQVYSADQNYFEAETQEPVKQKSIGGNSSAPSNPGGGVLLSGDCSDYIDLTGQALPITETGTTSGATNNYGPLPSKPNCWSEDNWSGSAGAAPDVTYKWTAPAQRRYKISLIGSDYDTVLLLYDFTCPIEPVYPDDFICGNDDFTGTRSQLTYVPLDEGQEILIVVDGFGGSVGSYNLTISEVQTSPVDSFMTDIMDSYPIPGMQACVIKDGDIIWTGAYGESYIGLNDVTDSTIFSLASISKTVTGTALMQLYEDGLIGLDDDINNYLPFQIINPFAPGAIITPRMLLAHTSAINDNWSIMQPMVGPGDPSIPLDIFLENYLVYGGAYYSSSNFNNWMPATRYDYCNVGNCIVALIVELNNPDSLSFDQYCQDNIFAPLGMYKTKWFLADFSDTMEIAMPYRTNLTPWGHYGRPYYPSGQLRSSSLQMARFLTAYMNYGQIDTVRILDSSSVDIMNTVQYPGIDRDEPNHPGDAGLGWFHVELFNKEFWGHLGRSWGVETGMFCCFDENTGVIVLSNENNVGPFPDENMFVIYELFEFASGWPYCSYTVGDVNGSANYNGLDITYGVAFFKGGNPPLCDYCQHCPDWHYCGDVNGSCNYNGLDITYGVAYFKGGADPIPCADCPPPGDTMFSAPISRMR